MLKFIYILLLVYIYIYIYMNEITSRTNEPQERSGQTKGPFGFAISKSAI